MVGLAAGQLAGVIEGVAGESLGLDVVEFQMDGLRGTYLTAGKYVSPRFYVGITNPISFSGDSSSGDTRGREMTLEYRVFQMLLLQLVGSSSASTIGLNLTGRYSY